MYEIITSDNQFREVIDELTETDRYAIDTEFHREKTYYPKLALVQLAWDDKIALVDPLSVDFSLMSKVLNLDITCVAHAATQDLEVIYNTCQTLPKKLFDTQIAAGFLGYATSSLNNILYKFLDIELTKNIRLTDWLKRPLTDKQKLYAASDVKYLLKLTDVLTSELIDLNRYEWAIQESELSVDKFSSLSKTPTDLLNKIREARHLKENKRKIALSIVDWRENKAAELDIPVRQVLPDIAVATIAQKNPKSKYELSDIRGLDPRFLKNGNGQEIIDAVGRAENYSVESKKIIKGSDISRKYRPLIVLISSWISQYAKDNKLDPALLATRSDIESFLKGDKESRINYGWRKQMIGEPVKQLSEGKAALSFEPEVGLILEPRKK